ncbi:MAG: hypothetical protein LUQ47_06110 [Methanotrichaceae archaeon]|nr:hypothetical protein [Methanotrichaceae archaeon]
MLDIYRSIIARKLGWKPCFGQINSAQRHLEKQVVGQSNLFLNSDGSGRPEIAIACLSSVLAKRPARHFWLYADRSSHEDHWRDKGANWLEYHPHNSEHRRKNKTNTIYVAKNQLSWNRQLLGAGTFKFNENLILTKNGLTGSKWLLPEFFKAATEDVQKICCKNRTL